MSAGERWAGPNGFVAATTKLKVIAESKGITMAELAVAWVLRIPEVSVALVGGKSSKQSAVACEFGVYMHTLLVIAAKDSDQVRMNAGYNELTAAEVDEIAKILEDAPETGIGHLRALPNPVDGLTGAEDA